MKQTILVVDDDNENLMLLKHILGAKDYQVMEALDGEQAIDVVKSFTPDLILLDLQLPKLNGLGVARHLREILNLSSLPIVIMTGCDPETARGGAMACGCNDFLPKPIDFDHLEAVLNYYVPSLVDAGSVANEASRPEES